MRPFSADALAKLPPDKRRELLGALTAEQLDVLCHSWQYLARDDQLLPGGDWTTWLVLAGRGYGKSRVGAETVSIWARAYPRCRIALVAATGADVRDTVVEGESGIMNIGRECERPIYQPSKRRIIWPNGSQATTFTADEPDRLRGPQHHFAWADELAAWRYPDAWDQLMFGLRLGRAPQVVVTTTPRPTPIIKELLAASTTHVTRGSTFDNKANLAPSFLEKIVKKYEGTRLGRQELYAEVLDDNPGALWKRAQLDAGRVTRAPETLRQVVVAIDPAVSSNPDSDETGIVVVAVGDGGHLYILDDASGIYTPREWAERACELYRKWRADRIVCEVNQGGDLVESNLRTVDRYIPITQVRATRGKAVRAEPVAGLYEQGRVHHVGYLAKLEEQMVEWCPAHSDKSPDRVDAMVWGVTYLGLGETIAPQVAGTVHTIESPTEGW